MSPRQQHQQPRQEPPEDMTQSWAEAQRRLWEGWLEGLRQASGGFAAPTSGAPNQAFTRTLDTWESFVRQTLDAQSSAMQAWVDQLTATPNLPPPVSAQVQQLQELARGWTDTQRQLWDAMFAAVRQFAASTGEQAAAAGSDGQAPGAETWQQLARPILEAQASWLRQWSSVLGGSQPRR